MTLEEAKKKAVEKVLELGSEYFPEEYWFGIAPDWDLNIWTDECGTRQVSVYPVKDGEVSTTVCYPVDCVALFSGEKESHEIQS